MRVDPASRQSRPSAFFCFSLFHSSLFIGHSPRRSPVQRCSRMIADDECAAAEWVTADSDHAQRSLADSGSASGRQQPTDQRTAQILTDDDPSCTASRNCTPQRGAWRGGVQEGDADRQQIAVCAAIRHRQRQQRTDAGTSRRLKLDDARSGLSVSHPPNSATSSSPTDCCLSLSVRTDLTPHSDALHRSITANCTQSLS